MIINDGTGSGYDAQVDSSNRLRVFSTTVTAEHHAAHNRGQAYQLVISQSPTAADDCIFYIQNTSDEDLVIEGMKIGVINCTADDSIYFKLGDSGTRDSATALTPVNVNAGSGNVADGTFEKGADLDGGAATLTGGTEFDRIVFAGVTDSSSQNYNFEMDVILPKNRVLTGWVGGSATGTYYITVNMYFEA